MTSWTSWHPLRVDHDAANTMEDCLLIEETLGGKICKNLFLYNRQETEFYLLMMPGGKPFKTKYLSAQLGCSRLSFADAEHMAQLLHTIPGSVSALELLFDTKRRVKLVIDRDLLKEETISGHPGFSTSTLRLSREDLLRYMGLFEAIFQALSIDADFENISIDSTSCKVHQSANGGGKNRR